MALANEYPRFLLSEAPKESAVEQRRVSDSSLLHDALPVRTNRRSSNNSISTVDSSSRSAATSDSARPSVVSSATSVGSEHRAPLVRNPSSGEGLSQGMRRSSDQNVGEGGLINDRELMPDGMMVIRKSCRYDCYCACHEKQPEKTQRRFSGSKNRKPACTEPTCVSNLTIDDQYVDYSKRFRKAVSQAMSSKGVNIRHDMKTFRLVLEGSDAMRHVKHGNLEKLRACIESGEATIWDTAPDGWSLLHVRTFGAFERLS